MRAEKRWIAAAGVLTAAVALSACGTLSGSTSATSTSGGNGSMMSSGATQPAMPTPSVNTMSNARGGLMEVKKTMAGLVLANPHGMTVYYYSGDKPHSGVSSCTGSCAVAWPPVISPVRLPAGVKLAGQIGYIVRANGQRQVTVDGYPIYRYANDMAPGQTSGNGVDGNWHLVKAKKTKSSPGSGSRSGGSGSSGSAGSGSSGSGSGGGW